MAILTNEDGDQIISGPNEFNLFFVSYHNGISGGYAELGINDNDTILGGTSADVIQLSAGTDIIDGGQGTSDTIEVPMYLSIKTQETDVPGAYLSAQAADLVVNLGSGTYSVNWRESTVTGNILTSSIGTLAGIEVVSDSRGDDRLTGSNYTAMTDSGRIVGETFLVSEGADVINGRGGVDTLGVGGYQVSNIIFAGTVIDVRAGTMRGLDGVIDRFSNIERFSMTGNADTFTGNKNDNWVITYGGGDTLSGGKGFDVLDYGWVGSAGSAIFADAQSGIVTDGTWSDMFTGFEQIRGTRLDDTMRGSAKGDDFFGNRGADTLRGLNGNDVLNGGDDNDALLGGAGDDTLVGGEGVDSFDGGKGSDMLDYRLENPLEYTLGVNVTLKNNKAIDPWGNEDTTTAVENVFGTRFRDLIKGDKEDNDIFGGKGRDNLGGLDGDDRLFGGDGKDSLGGGGDDDILRGGNEDDKLFGGAGDDELFGEKGEDILFGNKGADILNGGKNKDQLRDDKSSLNMYHFGNDDIRDALSNGLPPIIGANKQANHLMGKDGDDTLLGTGYLEGGKGKDELRGAGYLDGGKGNDMLFADPAFDATGSGYAVLSGGMGNDVLTGAGPSGTTASYVYSQTGLTLNLLNGTASLGAGDNDTLVNVETVFATGFDDNLKGTVAMSENLYGLGGSDKITIRTSAITIDTGTGGGGKDQLFSYGDGKAILSGGKGADKILVRSAEAAVEGGAGNDVITFFRNDADTFDTIKGGGGNDTIRLKGSGSASAEGGSGNDTFILSGTVALDDRFVISGGAGRDTIEVASAVKLVRVLDFEIGKDKMKIGDALPGGINTFAALKAAATDSGNEVRIDLADGGELYLSGMVVSDLQSGMFIF